jgi:hypothetical protein
MEMLLLGPRSVEGVRVDSESQHAECSQLGRGGRVQEQQQRQQCGGERVRGQARGGTQLVGSASFAAGRDELALVGDAGAFIGGQGPGKRHAVAVRSIAPVTLVAVEGPRLAAAHAGRPGTVGHPIVAIANLGIAALDHLRQLRGGAQRGIDNGAGRIPAEDLAMLLPEHA